MCTKGNNKNCPPKKSREFGEKWKKDTERKRYKITNITTFFFSLPPARVHLLLGSSQLVGCFFKVKKKKCTTLYIQTNLIVECLPCVFTSIIAATLFFSLMQKKNHQVLLIYLLNYKFAELNRYYFFLFIFFCLLLSVHKIKWIILMHNQAARQT